ncbi:hypothetical protein PS15m_007459 [Mucor circinelloides]
MTEIGRVKVPDSLSSIESFATMKNLQTLLYVTHVFWYCCYPASLPNYSPLPSIWLTTQVPNFEIAPLNIIDVISFNK